MWGERKKTRWGRPLAPKTLWLPNGSIAIPNEGIGIHIARWMLKVMIAKISVLKRVIQMAQQGTEERTEAGACMCSASRRQGEDAKEDASEARISRSKRPCNAGIDDIPKQAGPLSGA